MSATSTIDATKLASLIEAEEATFNERHHASRAMTDRAGKSLAGGVASSWQATSPHPIYLAEGHGSKVIDVDGNEYVDFHNGYGAMAVGHGHPHRRGRLRARPQGHALRPADRAGVAVAEHLQQRFGCRCGGFGNSGTESTLDSVRLMRAYTGRDVLLKIEGSYHGHHDALMVMRWPTRRQDRQLRGSGLGAPDAGVAGRLRQPDQGRAVQRPGGAGADAGAQQGAWRA
jgi:glutamate-1-semialdehyde 2,1-aminomutase